MGSVAPRSQYSIRRSLVEKAKEAALTAIQAYNSVAIAYTPPLAVTRPARFP